MDWIRSSVCSLVLKLKASYPITTNSQLDHNEFLPNHDEFLPDHDEFMNAQFVIASHNGQDEVPLRLCQIVEIVQLIHGHLRRHGQRYVLPIHLLTHLDTSSSASSSLNIGLERCLKPHSEERFLFTITTCYRLILIKFRLQTFRHIGYWTRATQRRERASRCKSAGCRRHPLPAHFFLSMNNKKCLTLQMKFKVTKYNIRNGAIRWQKLNSIKVILQYFSLALTVFELFTF